MTRNALASLFHVCNNSAFSYIIRVRDLAVSDFQYHVLHHENSIDHPTLLSCSSWNSESLHQWHCSHWV